jgi:hypothetical protein
MKKERIKLSYFFREKNTNEEKESIKYGKVRTEFSREKRHEINFFSFFNKLSVSSLRSTKCACFSGLIMRA